MDSTLNNLSQFEHFDIDRFLEGKKLIVTGIRPWTDYPDKTKILGTIVECVISEDTTKYEPKNGILKSNRFARISLKIRMEVNSNVNPPLDSSIMPVNPIGKVYGQYRNQLKIECEDVAVLASS